MRALETHAPLLLYYKSSWNVKTSPFSHKNFLFGPRAAVGLACPIYKGRVGAGNITHPINVREPWALTARVHPIWQGSPWTCRGSVTLAPRSLRSIHPLRHWALPQTRWDWLPVRAIPTRRGTFPQSGSAGARENRRMSSRLEAAEGKAAVSTKADTLEGKRGQLRGRSKRLEPRDLVAWTESSWCSSSVRETQS